MKKIQKRKTLKDDLLQLGKKVFLILLATTISSIQATQDHDDSVIAGSVQNMGPVLDKIVKEDAYRFHCVLSYLYRQSGMRKYFPKDLIDIIKVKCKTIGSYKFFVTIEFNKILSSFYRKSGIKKYFPKDLVEVIEDYCEDYRKEFYYYNTLKYARIIKKENNHLLFILSNSKGFVIDLEHAQTKFKNINDEPIIKMYVNRKFLGVIREKKMDVYDTDHFKLFKRFQYNFKIFDARLFTGQGDLLTIKSDRTFYYNEEKKPLFQDDSFETVTTNEEGSDLFFVYRDKITECVSKITRCASKDLHKNKDHSCEKIISEEKIRTTLFTQDKIHFITCISTKEKEFYKIFKINRLSVGTINPFIESKLLPSTDSWHLANYYIGNNFIVQWPIEEDGTFPTGSINYSIYRANFNRKNTITRILKLDMGKTNYDYSVVGEYKESIIVLRKKIRDFENNNPCIIAYTPLYFPMLINFKAILGSFKQAFT